MGNIFFCCLGVGGRGGRRRNVPTPPTTETTPLQPPVNQSVSVVAATASYQNLCYCSSPPEITSDHHDQPTHLSMPQPSVVYKEAVTIRNDTNLRKTTLRLEPDPVNPGHLLVAFTFDSLVSGRITVVFFAKEDEITATKEDTITFEFEKGVGQKFIQPSGTGMDLSELFKEAEPNTFPLAIKMEAADSGSKQITLVTYVKEKDEIKPSVIKQILWVNGTRYELQEIYGIGDTVDEDARKECVVCLAEPRDTTVLPCRHMCMCGGCAKELRFQINSCPVCRQPVERLLKIHLKGAMEEIKMELTKSS